MSLIVIATFSVRAGREADAEAAFEELVDATHAEEGCERYALHRDPANPLAFVFVERWASAEAHAAHDETAHVARIRARIDELFQEEPDVRRLEPLPLGDAAKGTV